MKKYLAVLILSLAFTGCANALEPVDPLVAEPVDTLVAEPVDPLVADPQETIFRSSLTDIVHEVQNQSDEYSDDLEFQDIDPNSMPFFKQMRLKLTNKYLEYTTKRDNSTRKPIHWKFWDKTEQQAVSDAENAQTQAETTNDIIDSINNEITKSLSDEELSLEGGINTEVTDKQLMLDADNITFDDETGDMIANGRPILVLPPQNTKVVANVMTYNEDSNIIKGEGDIVVTKDGKPIFSDYLEIDMNEETMQMNNMTAKTPNMNTKAESAIQKDGMLILTKGSMNSESESITRIASRMIGPRFHEMMVDEDSQALFFGNPEGNDLHIHFKDISIDAQKNHDVIKTKNITFYHKDRPFFRWPHLTIYTNKQRDYFEANYPEFGSRRKLGMFAGPGFVFGGPLGSVVKVIPFVNYKDDFGIGGMLKYINTHNRTELGYGSANEIFFLRGKQKFDDNLYLHYGANSYTDEWFMGARMAKYMAEIYYDKSYVNKNFLAKGLDLTFRHRAGFGLMEDDDRNYYGEKFSNATNMSTTRTRYMAEINQKLFKYLNEEKRTRFEAGILMQGSAALYGTGDTQFVARIGPNLKMQYKNWMQDISYFLTGYDDQSPMPRYDAYRYGRQSVRITEAFRLTKYLSVGWSGYISLSDDTPNGKMFQENAFLFSMGPDDFKIILGYDFVRQRTYFGFNVAFNPKGTEITYDKMVIKNPERLGKNSDENEHQVAYAAPRQNIEQPERKMFNKSSAPQVLQYAQVIEIEDPDKERID